MYFANITIWIQLSKGRSESIKLLSMLANYALFENIKFMKVASGTYKRGFIEPSSVPKKGFIIYVCIFFSEREENTAMLKTPLCLQKNSFTHIFLHIQKTINCVS